MNGSLNQLYKVAGLTKQAFHQNLKRQAMFSEKLYDLFVQADVLKSEHPGCGVEKMYYTLKPDFIGRDRFIDIMMKAGYRVKMPKNFTKTTVPGHYKYPNLIEGSMVTGIDQVWQSDITYVLVGGDFYYAVFIIDVYSKRIVGYNVSNNMRAESNRKALKMAFKMRGNKDLSDLIHHSDRGSQYTSDSYTEMLKLKNISISMGMIATDNAYAERINGTIKNEFLKYRDMLTLKDLKREISKAVKYYNKKRPHNHLSRRSPENFEDNLIDLNIQERPTVIIYTDGNDKIKEASSLYGLDPEKNLWTHNCPIYNELFINQLNGQH